MTYTTLLKIIIMEKELSIIVCTHKRPNFLLRFLRYYNYLNLKYQLIIGDGGKDKLSKEIHKEIKKNNKIIYKKFDNEFNVLKKEYDIEKFFIRRIKCLNLVNTQYVKFVCDDDFIINYTTKKCVEFLNQNKSYIAAGGSYLDYTLNKKYYGKFIHINRAHLSTSNDSNCKIKRIKKYYKRTTDTFHYVFRTKDLIKIHLISSKFKNDNTDFKYHYFENIVFLSGKTKFFKDPLILHESHNDWHEGTGGEMIERLKDPFFLNNLESFSKHIYNYFKIKNYNFIKNLYYKNIVIRGIKNIENKNYIGIIGVAKYLNNILKVKYKIFRNIFFFKSIDIKKIFGSQIKIEIINEVKNFQSFLENNK